MLYDNNFHHETKGLVLSKHGVNTEAQFLSETGGILSGPYAFLVSRPESAEKMSLDVIILVDIK